MGFRQGDVSLQQKSSSLTRLLSPLEHVNNTPSVLKSDHLARTKKTSADSSAKSVYFTQRIRAQAHAPWWRKQTLEPGGRGKEALSARGGKREAEGKRKPAMKSWKSPFIEMLYLSVLFNIICEKEYEFFLKALSHVRRYTKAVPLVNDLSGFIW